MNDILKIVAAALKPVEGKRLAVGVSGGRDSMCLLHAVINCGAVDKENILAVHVNHCLREEADGDEAFVREYCEKNGIAFKSFRVDVKGESAAKGLTVEQAARELRYGVMYGLIRSGEADVVLTAHHALDNAESVLMHMFRGSGIDGLSGMHGGAVLRPFITVYPEELDAYAAHNDIKYVVDKTNFMTDTDRNFIRLKVIPLIEERYPRAVRAINGLAEECADTSDYLDGLIDRSLITRDRGATLIKESALTGGLAERYVRAALKDFSLTDATREQTESVIALCDKSMGAIAELNNGVIAVKEYGFVALYIHRQKFTGETELTLGANYIDGLAVDVEECKKLDMSVRGGTVDLDKTEGASLRFRRDGDMFTPFGGGAKKLKQYFIDKKIPARLRDRIPLVCRGREVLVAVGVEISDKVKVTDGTVRAATVKRRW